MGNQWGKPKTIEMVFGKTLLMLMRQLTEFKAKFHIVTAILSYTSILVMFLSFVIKTLLIFVFNNRLQYKGNLLEGFVTILFYFDLSFTVNKFGFIILNEKSAFNKVFCCTILYLNHKMLYSVVFSPLNYNLYAKEHYKWQAAWGGKCHFFFVLIAFVPILTEYLCRLQLKSLSLLCQVSTVAYY